MCGHNHPTMIKIHSFFFNPQKPKQSQLSSHFDFVVNTSTLFHLQYHDWGETLEQDTEPPTAPRALQQYGCPLLRVCVYGVCVCVHCRAGPSLYGALSRILFGGPSVPPIWLLSKLDYSHTINLTHPLSVLFDVAVLLTSYYCLPGMFLPFCDF